MIGTSESTGCLVPWRSMITVSLNSTMFSYDHNRELLTLTKMHSSALRDFVVNEGTTRRHMLRITPQAERPYFDPNAEKAERLVEGYVEKPGTITK